jgi:hypothetical protein
MLEGRFAGIPHRVVGCIGLCWQRAFHFWSFSVNVYQQIVQCIRVCVAAGQIWGLQWANVLSVYQRLQRWALLSIRVHIVYYGGVCPWYL